MLRLVVLLALSIGGMACAVRAENPTSLTAVPLARNGRVLLPIVVGETAGDRTKRAAATLADYLNKIFGVPFQVIRGNGREGLAIGLPQDFPDLPFRSPWQENDPTQREDYVLRSHLKGVWLLGSTEQGVEHAVWDFLHRLGYRQFFPGPTWEVIPNDAEPTVAVDVHEHPDYFAHRIWYGGGIGEWSRPHYEAWCMRNRAERGIDVPSGHAYDAIIRRNATAFSEHPEYLGLLDGQRQSTKLCISNSGLRELVAADALRLLAADPDLQGVSVDPSDGGNWCQCAACAAMGGISNRTVTLANEVAATVIAKYPDKWVAMYAYNEHSAPPTIDVHPRVIVNIATAFIKGGQTVEQLLAGWQARKATVGIREYYSVHPWDRDLPGRARGGNLTYLADAIPRHHALGARFMSAESSDNWGPNGLGYYTAARILWNVHEAKSIEAIREDFLLRCFQSAAPTMRRYYELLDTARKPLLSDDLLGRMYRTLDEAKRAESDPKVQARLNDLVLYTRYCELWQDYETAAGAPRQAAFERLARHALRIRGTLMVHTLGLLRDVPHRDRQLVVPKEAHPKSPDDKNPWLDPKAFRAEEIDELLAQGIERRQLLDFTPVAFSDNLVRATPLQLPNAAPGSMGLFSRGERTYHTWVDKPPAKLTLTVRTGLVYQNQGDARLTLFPRGEVELKSTAERLIPPDKQSHSVECSTTYSGAHRIVVFDRTAGTSVVWPDGMPMTVVSAIDQPAHFHGRWSLSFYVPRGTKVVGGFSGGEGRLLDADGKTVHNFSRAPGYFRVAVPAGQDARLWTFAHSSGDRLLMTVPPCLARCASELLLPREVVERDRQ